MYQAFEGHSESEDEYLATNYSQPLAEKELPRVDQFLEECKKVQLDPPRQIPNRSYSLQPDMAGGWRPKQNHKANFSKVFSINYHSDIIDEIVKELYKNKSKEKLVFLGTRRSNTYLLHEGRSYQNPYPVDKKMDQIFSSRHGMPHHPQVQETFLKFDSDFESGNLDVAIQRGPSEFDLFMRVDTNTRGHTNWFYFSVNNKEFMGEVKFTLCNFRRQKSLYQRGLKPYVFSKELDSDWHQGGKKVTYQQQRPRYNFLYEEGEFEDYILNTYFSMSFTYQFAVANDTVMFAYSVPYTYSKMIKMISNLNAKPLPQIKSLSGLNIPVLEVTDENEPEYNKQVVLVTARIHPGQANSSYVVEGFLEYVCGNDGKELRKSYIFVVIPMVNPDGVVAGNYRTSLFGKDLNRTFDKSRKYAFPETFHLVELAKELKMVHKKRFNLYLDLHGHSVKKNVFMYGPDFSIQHANYELSRELPRLLSSVTSLFRYYSCIFRITSQKATTSRAILNRKLDIAFTYTMQSSNGFYYDSVAKAEMPFTHKKYKEMGVYLAKVLALVKFDQQNRIKRCIAVKDIVKDDYCESDRNSDDNISEGGSDSQPQEEDMTEQELELLEQNIRGKTEENIKSEKHIDSPFKSSIIQKFDSRDLKKKEKHSVYLPPINTLNRAVIFSNRSKKKEAFKHERLKNMQSQPEGLNERARKPRYSISQIVTDYKEGQELIGWKGSGKDRGYNMFGRYKVSK